MNIECFPRENIILEMRLFEKTSNQFSPHTPLSIIWYFLWHQGAWLRPDEALCLPPSWWYQNTRAGLLLVNTHRRRPLIGRKIDLIKSIKLELKWLNGRGSFESLTSIRSHLRFIYFDSIMGAMHFFSFPESRFWKYTQDAVLIGAALIWLESQ